MKIKTEILEKYGFADPASGKGRIRRSRARQAIVVIGVDWLMRVFVLEAWSGRLVTSRFRDKIISIYDKWQPKLFGIEANAMQELFGDEVIERAKEKLGGNVRMAGISQSTRIEKDFRIRTTLEPVISDGRLIWHSDHTELASEVVGFPTAMTKDIVDALASAIALVPRRPKKIRENREADELAEYLRNTGAPSWYILKKMEEMGQETMIGG